MKKYLTITYAEEISAISGGMSVIAEEKDWNTFASGSVSEVSAALLYLAGNLNLRKFKKNKRGPKKSPTPKDKFK